MPVIFYSSIVTLKSCDPICKTILSLRIYCSSTCGETRLQRATDLILARHQSGVRQSRWRQNHRRRQVSRKGYCASHEISPNLHVRTHKQKGNLIEPLCQLSARVCLLKYRKLDETTQPSAPAGKRDRASANVEKVHKVGPLWCVCIHVPVGVLE